MLYILDLKHDGVLSLLGSYGVNCPWTPGN